MFENLRQRIASAISPELLDQRNLARRAAMTDALTGLANRRAFDLALVHAEIDPYTSVMLFDLNNFGLVNKTSSHADGDRLLEAFAATLKIHARAYGIQERAFRIGGDEFAILAPRHIAPALRDSIEQTFGKHTRALVYSKNLLSGDYLLSKAEGATFTVSVSGTIGKTFADADLMLQARKKLHK